MLLSIALSISITGGLIGFAVAGVRAVYRAVKYSADASVIAALTVFALLTGGIGVYTALIMWWKQINPVAWAFVLFFTIIGFVSIVEFASIEAGKLDHTEPEA